MENFSYISNIKPYTLVEYIIKPSLEIGILWAVFYQILVFFEGTRAFQVLRGITYLLIVFLLSQLLGLNTLNWLLMRLFAISILAFLIIFQQEIRQGLARLGQQHLFNIALAESEIIALIDEIASAVFKLAQQNTGCLIAIERETKLRTYVESGVALDAKLSSELLQSIFTQATPLHDGGIVVQGDRIVAASCLFPLSDNPHFSKITGTRHRAAVGMSEQTDALVIMVSEESGEVSFAANGKLTSVQNHEKLTDILKNSMVIQHKKKK